MRLAGTLSTDQWQSFIRFVGAFAGGILVARGVAPTQVTSLIDQLVGAVPVIINAVAVLAPIVSLIWSLIRHTDKGNVLAASDVPGVAKVLVKPSAAPALVTIANDTSIPKVELVKPPGVKP